MFRYFLFLNSNFARANNRFLETNSGAGIKKRVSLVDESSTCYVLTRKNGINLQIAIAFDIDFDRSLCHYSESSAKGEVFRRVVLIRSQVARLRKFHRHVTLQQHENIAAAQSRELA